MAAFGMRVTYLYRIVVLVAAALLCAQTLLAQYKVNVWTTDEGLPQNSVNAIVQTRDGYLWIGTYGGLARFDGLKFTSVGFGNVGIASNRVTSVAESRDGGLWIGTEGGGLVRYRNGMFTPYGKQQGSEDEVIFSVLEDRNGIVWTANRLGVQRLMDSVFVPVPLGTGMPPMPVRNLVIDRSGDIWANSDGGTFRIHDGHTVEAVKIGSQSKAPTAFLFEDADGSKWFRTADGLMWMQNGITHVVQQTAVFRTDFVTFMKKDAEGFYWLGSLGNGLYRYDRSRQQFKSFALPDGNSKYRVLTSYIDREGNQWFGTEGEGLIRIKEQMFQVIGLEQGLTNEIIEAVLEDSHGNIWFGTNCGGLYRYADGSLTHFTTNGILANECIWSLAEDRDGTIWAGSYGGGLLKFRDGRFTKYTTADGLAHNAVLALYPDREGNLWIGTLWGGVSIYHDGTFKSLQTKDGLAHNSVRTFMEDRSGAMWIGTLGGLTRYRDGVLKNFTVADGLSHNYVRSIYEDDEGTLWIGTYGGGLNRLKNGRFTHYTTREGLYDNVVSVILEDNDKNLWMTCNNGIYRTSRQALNDMAEGRRSSISCVAYGREDGLKSTETNGGFQPAGWKTHDGKLLFPTIKGLAILDLSRMKHNVVPPAAFIEQVLVEQRAQAFDHPIVLPYSDYHIEVHFTGLSFIDPGNVRFKYMLKGFEDEWIDAGTRRAAYYANLPPGEYEFDVVAQNRDGIWSNRSASLRIIILTPFWQTWWFRAAVILFVGGIAYGLVRTRIAHIEQRRTMQEEFTHRLVGSEKKYRSLFEDSKDAIVITSRDGKILDINSAGMLLLGFTSQAEVEATNAAEALYSHPQEREELFRRLQAQGFVSNFETIARRKSGETFRLNSTITAVYDRGEIVAVRGIFRDVTKERQAEEALRRSEDLFRSLVENISEVYFVADASGNISFGSPQFFAATGYQPQEILGKNYIRLIAPPDRKQVMEFYFAQAGKGISDTQCEFHGLRKNGSTPWVEQVTHIVRDSNGEVKEYRNLVREITRRKEAERRSEAFSRLGHDLSSVVQLEEAAAIIATVADHLIGWSGCSIDLYAEDTDRLTPLLDVRTIDGKRVAEHVTQETEQLSARVRSVLKEGARLYLSSASFPMVNAQDPSVDPLDTSPSVMIVPIRYLKRVIGTLGIGSHVVDAYTIEHLEVLQALADHGGGAIERIRIETNRHRLFEEVQSARARLQFLSERLLSMQEDERRHIARELHDEIGQALTAVKINLQSAERSLGAAILNPPLSDSVKIVERALMQVRSLSLNLRPSILDDLGLVPALRWFVDRQRQRGLLSVQFVSDEFEERFAPEIEIACFRVVQEAVTNVVRHAKATSLDISLRKRDRQIDLTISDNGKGFPIDEMRERALHGRSLGVLGMEERVQLAGGEFTIESSVNTGTTIHATFPLRFLEPPIIDFESELSI